MSYWASERPLTSGIRFDTLPVTKPPAGRKSTFILSATEGRRCESAFALLSPRESNKEGLPPCGGYGKMGFVRG